ncbi:hypothetical protein SPFM12_00086 [Salmonella phage SPFM12]|nr:hypothetical protein SPFM12_00086 [Salmonella phage SPFM12]
MASYRKDAAFYGAKMTPPKAFGEGAAVAMIKKKSPVGKRWHLTKQLKRKPSTAEIALGYRLNKPKYAVQLAAVYMKHIEETKRSMIRLYGKQLNIPKNADKNVGKNKSSSASSVVQMTTGKQGVHAGMLATTIYRESRFNFVLIQDQFNEIKPLIVTASRMTTFNSNASYQTTSNKHQKESINPFGDTSMFRTILFLLVAGHITKEHNAVRAVFPDWERKTLLREAEKIIPNSFK